jgi:nitroreductase
MTWLQDLLPPVGPCWQGEHADVHSVIGICLAVASRESSAWVGIDRRRKAKMQQTPMAASRLHVLPSAAAVSDYVSLVQFATLAASSHNTQPWRFELKPDRIVILPDFSRRCPAVDPDDHHLFASLGCAAENLLLAARAAGLAGYPSYDAARTHLSVELESAAPERCQRFEAIALRQCSRARYDGSPLTVSELRALEAAGSGPGVGISLIADKSRNEQVAEYVAAGNRAQFGDPHWAREMRKWIRFNAREAATKRDGLYGPALGIPRVPRRLGELLMPLATSAERQSRKDVGDIRSSGAVAVLYSDADDPTHWIEAGRCVERLALEATALGLRTAFINQPVEVGALRQQFAAFLGIGSRRPDLVLRIGRGPAMPRSLRRPVQQFLELSS